MKSAQKEKLLSYFQNNYQYEIPFFQRSYVWDEENWELFRENLDEEVDAHNNQDDSEHFIGTIITKPLTQSGFDTVKHELIDGQQRLTTITIILKALADTVTGKLPNLKNNLLGYLIFQDTQGKEYLRLTHSKLDAPYYQKVMKVLKEDEQVEKADHQMVRAYYYFKDTFSEFTDEQRDIYSKVLLHKLPVIAMFLAENDDEQEIFDTINSLGVRLTISELLKNYIFRDDELKPLYEEYWFNLFESEEEDTNFWNATKTSGRIKRTNLELLLYCVLIIETGKEVKIEKLFNQFKKYLKDKSTEEKKAFLKRLHNHAKTYREFPSSSQLSEIQYSDTETRVFHVIEYLEITTVYPLLLKIYDGVTDDTERLSILEILESYLVRRVLTKLTSKNYNRFFIQLIGDLSKQEYITAKVFAEKLLGFTQDTNRFPNDEEFKEAFKHSYLYNKYAREILFIIVLYQLDNDYSDVRKLSVNSYSVEHMMPKKWREHWDDGSLTEEQKSDRDWILKRMGNLTLITRSLNSSLRNQPWSKKKETLAQYSKLPITTSYLNEEWNEINIKQRAKNLGSTALKIWKIPSI